MKTNEPALSQDKTIERLNHEIELLRKRIIRLEEENASFAGMLRERGVKVQAISKVSLELPPPVTEPLKQDADVFSLMSDAERRLFDNVVQGAPVMCLVQTSTKVDTGGWLKKAGVWAGATNSDLFMLAAGKKPFLDKIPFNELRKSIFNHVTGCLILAPGAELKISSLAMAPLDGYQLLAQIYNEGGNQND